MNYRDDLKLHIIIDGKEVNELYKSGINFVVDKLVSDFSLEKKNINKVFFVPNYIKDTVNYNDFIKYLSDDYKFERGGNQWQK